MPPRASAPPRRPRAAGPRGAPDSRRLEGRLEVLLEVGAEERLRLDHGLDPEEPLAELRGARQPLGVPAEVLAELDDRPPGVALQAEREGRVLERDPEPLGGRGRRRERPASEQRVAGAEDPWGAG